MSTGQPTTPGNAPRVTVEMTGAAGYETLTGWSGLQIQRAVDAAADSFALSVPYDPTAANRARFAPFAPTKIRVFVGDELVLRGYVEKVDAVTSAAQRSITIEGRSETGVLMDWSVGPKYQFEGTFNTIAREATTPPAGTGPTVRAIPDTPLLTAEAEIGQTVWEFLGQIASANGLWAVPTVVDNAAGGGSIVEFRRIGPGQAPVAQLIEGASPVVEISTAHDVTHRHHEYTVTQESGGANASATVTDRAMAPAIRGRSVRAIQQESGDLQAAAAFERSRSLVKAYSARATVTGWTYDGQLWRPGTIVVVNAPGALVNQPTPLMISRTILQMDETGGQQTELALVLPELYAGGYPQRLPWA